MNPGVPTAFLRCVLFLLLGTLAGGLVPSVAAPDRSSSHWAFRPIVRPAPPDVTNQAWARNAVDRFILQRLESEQASPSPEASRAILIRRVFLDLTGLPPSGEAVSAFENDPSPDAYERMVEAALASPHFGERWGRHWLDLARYADSDGYEKDGPRPYAYYFRDWVVQAWNADMPFNRFTELQIAGDLLRAPSRDDRVAVGFHRNTLSNREGGVDPEEDRCKNTVDRVSTTATAWMGLTAGCAECHDHKYDPVSQREFYGLFAFFNSIVETNIAAPLDSEWRRHAAERAAWESGREMLRAAVFRAAAWNGGDDGEDLNQGLKALEKHLRQPPSPPGRHIPTLAEAAAARRTFVHVRGDFLRHGEEVSRHTPRFLPALHVADGTPTRLDLARWLASPSHPLTARVAANRIWQHLFGRGIVATPNDFGTRGEPPSHPGLLDWLAAELVDGGWSQKHLIRLVVCSATYRQSSAHRADLAGRDPENRWLARQSRLRLDAETLRDSALAVSGLLNRQLGGPSIRPPMPADVTDVAYAGQVKWAVSPPADQHRRSLYIFIQRTVLYPMLTTFDAPDGITPCTRRERSNTPTQALTLLNDPNFFECAAALGTRIAAQCGPPAAMDVRDAIRGLFQAALLREPTRDELGRLLEFHSRQRELQRESADAANPALHWIAMARALLNLEEFFTRE